MRAEIEHARSTLLGRDPDQILGDPYQVSALYYSDSFFEKLEKTRKKPKNKSDRSPQDEIVVAIKALLFPEGENSYLDQLKALYAEATEIGDCGSSVAPLDDYEFKKCSSRCHPDAVDLFTNEGSLVRTMTNGVVVLAQEGWDPDQPLATVSRRGSNEVIIFNPETNQFYRYSHLDMVFVQTSDIIPAGIALGTVGHSGKNASRRGLGQHLHLEINQYDPKTYARGSVSRKALTQILKKIKSN